MALTPRHRWLKELLRILRDLDSNKYFVRRGAILWDTFSWPKSFAVSVRCPENFPASSSNPKQTTLVLTIGTRIPGSDAKEDIDDEKLDVLEQDMIDALSALKRFTSENNNVIITSELQGSVEWHSADFNVQGYVVTFMISY